jgi:hypothetical protein
VIVNLIDVQKALRKLPIVRLTVPTVVLVGAPNVGKSSIVRAISSGTPEVNDYPFTTRGMTLGHIQYEDWVEKCQVGWLLGHGSASAASFTLSGSVPGHASTAVPCNQVTRGFGPQTDDDMNSFQSSQGC